MFLFVLVACGGGGARGTGGHGLSANWKPGKALAYIPPDTPYLMGVFEPMDDKTLDALYAGYAPSAQAYVAKDAGRDPETRLYLGLAKEIAGKARRQWWNELGLDPSGRFVIYGEGAWPVVRVEVADEGKASAMLARVFGGAGAVKTDNVWRFDASDKVEVTAAVSRGELVFAVMPKSLDAELEPRLFAATGHQDEVASELVKIAERHHMPAATIGWVDTRRAIDTIAAAAARPDWGGDDKPLTPACVEDLHRMAAVAPRLVLGYTRLDLQGFDVHTALELDPQVLAALRALKVSLPPLVARSANPLAELLAGLDVDKTLAWLQTVADGLTARPLHCEGLDKLGQELGPALGELQAKMPPFARGVRGFELVVDEVRTSPKKDATGYAAVFSDHVVDFVQLMATQPGFPKLPVGTATAVPAAQLNLPLSSVHAFLQRDRLVVGFGPDSAARATEQGRAASKPAPLMWLHLNSDALSKWDASMKMDETFKVSDETISVDVRDDGLAVDMSGTWANDRPAIAR